MREYVLGLFKQRRIKRTKPRILVLEYLLRRERPVTVEEMYASLSEKFRLGLTSVYRAVEQLVELGVASREQLSPRLFAYQLCKTTVHHHHIVCTECGKIKEIIFSGIEQVLRDEAQRSHFYLKSHEISLSGRCSECVEKDSGQVRMTLRQSRGKLDPETSSG
jgi:Fur family ferric uptake transcriptional regulator